MKRFILAVLLSGLLCGLASAETVILADVDGDLEVTLNDRQTIYLAMQGVQLTQELVDEMFPNCVRCHPQAIFWYIQVLWLVQQTWDIDGDGAWDQNPDGLWMFWWNVYTPAQLFNFAPPKAGCTRCSAGAMADYMDFLHEEFIVD